MKQDHTLDQYLAGDLEHELFVEKMKMMENKMIFDVEPTGATYDIDENGTMIIRGVKPRGVSPFESIFGKGLADGRVFGTIDTDKSDREKMYDALSDAIDEGIDHIDDGHWIRSHISNQFTFYVFDGLLFKRYFNNVTVWLLQKDSLCWFNNGCVENYPQYNWDDYIKHETALTIIQEILRGK